MRTNGIYRTLNAEIEGPVFDEYGNPVAIEKSWSEPKPCFIQPNTNATIVTYADGEWVKASYIVLLEEGEFHSTRIMLEQKGRLLGEYQISVPQSVDSMGRIKLVV